MMKLFGLCVNITINITDTFVIVSVREDIILVQNCHRTFWHKKRTEKLKNKPMMNPKMIFVLVIVDIRGNNSSFQFAVVHCK